VESQRVIFQLWCVRTVMQEAANKIQSVS
jgi:hypothetical protein